MMVEGGDSDPRADQELLKQASERRSHIRVSNMKQKQAGRRETAVPSVSAGAA